MKRITQEPLVRFLGGKFWRLEEEFVYHVGSEDSEDVIVVPIGYVTDFASIPQPFRGIYPKAGPWGPAAIVHDWLCDTRTRSSKETHLIFREAMEVIGIPKLRRELFYRAVSWFGPKFEADDTGQYLAETLEEVAHQRALMMERKILQYGKRVG